MDKIQYVIQLVSIITPVIHSELDEEGLKNVTAGANPMALKRGIDIAVKEVIEKIKALENVIGRSFFPPNYIPDWACTGDSNGKPFPWVDDVVRYLTKNKDQVEMFDQPSCISFYGLCE